MINTEFIEMLRLWLKWAHTDFAAVLGPPASSFWEAARPQALILDWRRIAPEQFPYTDGLSQTLSFPATG